MKGKNLVKNNVVTVITILIVFQISIIILFGEIKNSYHLDELYTFGLSNSYFDPFLDWGDISNTWHNPDFYNDYLTVQDNHRFSYDSVCYNQENDVHPPLYYYGIHTICSFFPDVFSKWFGIGFNLLFFVGTIIVLYFLSKLITDNVFLAVVICAAYGFSTGTISNAIFIRMYMMLTFFIILTTYLHGVLILNRSNSNNSNNIICLMILINIMGFLTQYLFIIYIFFLAFGYELYLFKNRRFQIMIKYAFSMLVFLVLSIIFFPKCLSHIFFGYRGTNAILSFILIEDILYRIKAFVLLLCKALDFLPLLLLVLLIIIIKYRQSGVDRSECKFSRIVKKYLNLNSNIEKKVFLTIFIYSTIFTFLIISKISPYYTDRYIAYLLPNFTVISVLFAYIIMLNFIKNESKVINIIIIIIILCSLLSYINDGVDYVYGKDTEYINNALAKYIKYDAYCVATKRNDITISIPLLFKHEKSCYISNSEEFLNMNLNSGKKNEPIVIYIPHCHEDYPSDREIINSILERSEYCTFKQLVYKEKSIYSTDIYLLE